MDTRTVYVFGLALAVGVLMWQMAGFASLFAASSPAEQLETGGEFNQTAQNGTIQEGMEGDATAQDGNLVGLALSGIGGFFDMMGFLALLPYELDKLYLPWWAAWPIGLAAQMLLSIGLLQLSGKVFR